MTESERLYWACGSCESARPALPDNGSGDTRPCLYCAGQGMGDDYVEVVVSRELVAPSLAEEQEWRVPAELSQSVALDLLFESKDYRLPDLFLWADLVEDAEMHEWNGTHPVEDNTTIRMTPAGSTVLVTVASRLGDVGIRDKNLNPPCHGYNARVLPESLTNWRPIPEDAPKDWSGPKPPEKMDLNIIEVKPNRKARRARKARRSRRG